MHVACVAEPSFTKCLLPINQDKLCCQDEVLELYPNKPFRPECFFTAHFPKTFFFRKHPDLKVCKATLRYCRVMAVNFSEGCWRGCCSNVTLKDVWRKDSWGTTDITSHHPTSQLVSDFSEGCKKIFYQVKVQGRLWRRKQLCASKENKSIASS